MKAEFDFDGERLHLRIKVEDECEVAIAKLIGKFTVASVNLDYGRYGDYGYSHREQDPKAIDIYLKQPPKCFSTGKACELGCRADAGCQMAAQQASSQFAASHASTEEK